MRKNNAQNEKVSPAGNRTPVSRVTGGDTHHYTFFCIYGVPKGEVRCPRVMSTEGYIQGGKIQRGKERQGEGAPSQRPARQTRRGVEPRLTESLKIGKHRS